jgi:hypothetical protein
VTQRTSTCWTTDGGRAGALEGPGYRFTDLVADRLEHGSQRVALYLDGDPTNDPPVVIQGPAACAVCHNR